MRFERGFSSILILIGGIIIGVVVWGLYLNYATTGAIPSPFNPVKTPLPVSQQPKTSYIQSSPAASASTSGAIVGWKKYIDPNGSYSFLYPESWFIQRASSDLNGGRILFGNIQLSDNNYGPFLAGRVFGEINVVSNRGITEDAFYKRYFADGKLGEIGGGGPGTTVESVKDVILDGRKTRVVVTHPTSGYEWAKPSQKTLRYLSYASGDSATGLILEFNYDVEDSQVGELVNTFQKILATFKFLK